MTFTSRRVKRPLPAATPAVVWSTPSTVRLRRVTVRPSATVTLAAKFVNPGSRLMMVAAPAPCRTRLRGMVTWPSNVPALRFTVLPLVAQRRAAETVANGLDWEAALQAGFVVADADT